MNRFNEYDIVISIKEIGKIAKGTTGVILIADIGIDSYVVEFIPVVSGVAT